MKNSSDTIKLAGKITALKERFGIASAQAESLQGQLQQAQENLLRKEQEQQKTQEKFDRTFTGINGIKNHTF